MTTTYFTVGCPVAPDVDRTWDDAAQRDAWLKRHPADHKAVPFAVMDVYPGSELADPSAFEIGDPVTLYGGTTGQEYSVVYGIVAGFSYGVHRDGHAVEGYHVRVPDLANGTPTLNLTGLHASSLRPLTDQQVVDLLTATVEGVPDEHHDH